MLVPLFFLLTNPHFSFSSFYLSLSLSLSIDDEDFKSGVCIYIYINPWHAHLPLQLPNTTWSIIISFWIFFFNIYSSVWLISGCFFKSIFRFPSGLKFFWVRNSLRPVKFMSVLRRKRRRRTYFAWIVASVSVLIACLLTPLTTTCRFLNFNSPRHLHFKFSLSLRHTHTLYIYKYMYASVTDTEVCLSRCCTLGWCSKVDRLFLCSGKCGILPTSSSPTDSKYC